MVGQTQEGADALGLVKTSGTSQAAAVEAAAAVAAAAVAVVVEMGMTSFYLQAGWPVVQKSVDAAEGQHDHWASVRCLETPQGLLWV